MLVNIPNFLVSGKFDTFTSNVFYLYNHLIPMYEFKIGWHRYFDVPLYMIAVVT